MACEMYRNVRFKPKSLELIAFCNRTIKRYLGEGLTLTLRQLYYQLVVQNIITNEEKSYKNLGGLVSDGRLAGLIDWDAIEDRVRVPRRSSEFESLRELAQAALSSYRLPRWSDQEAYVEVWVEKDALTGVLQPIAREYHVTLMANKGYSSQSAMHDAGERFGRFGADGKDLILLYLGDHDPSGEDMVRDVGDRLAMFGAHVDVRKLALTTAQVKQYNPPPNPAKLSDSRAKAYIEIHGPYSRRNHQPAHRRREESWTTLNLSQT